MQIGSKYNILRREITRRLTVRVTLLIESKGSSVQEYLFYACFVNLEGKQLGWDTRFDLLGYIMSAYCERVNSIDLLIRFNYF